mmetsp:Transcript_108149/g.316217  ORF Transcript_108149/g.316217 Transcript_108149/m.316217 type:complete len:544 (-) Transcript_108149:7-1638(-)
MLQVLLDADGQLDRNVVVAEVTADIPELLGRVLLHAPDLGQGPRDAAHDVGEADEGEDHDGNREEPLHDVLRLHIHGGGRELGDRPVEGGQVLIEPARVLESVARHPRLAMARALRQEGDHEPGASNDVVDGEQQRDHLEDAQEDAGVLRVHPVVKACQKPPQLEDPQQPNGPDQSQDPQEPHRLARPVPGARHGEGPVGHDHDDVHAEPRAQVVDHDPARHHDDHPVVVVAHHDRRDHVQGPEDDGQPVHARREGAVWEVEHPEGDDDHVVEDEERSAHVPDHPRAASRIADEVAQEALVQVHFATLRDRDRLLRRKGGTSGRQDCLVPLHRPFLSQLKEVLRLPRVHRLLRGLEVRRLRGVRLAVAPLGRRERARQLGVACGQAGDWRHRRPSLVLVRDNRVRNLDPPLPRVADVRGRGAGGAVQEGLDVGLCGQRGGAVVAFGAALRQEPEAEPRNLLRLLRGLRGDDAVVLFRKLPQEVPEVVPLLCVLYAGWVTDALLAVRRADLYGDRPVQPRHGAACRDGRCGGQLWARVKKHSWP